MSAAKTVLLFLADSLIVISLLIGACFAAFVLFEAFPLVGKWLFLTAHIVAGLPAVAYGQWRRVIGLHGYDLVFVFGYGLLLDAALQIGGHLVLVPLSVIAIVQWVRFRDRLIGSNVTAPNDGVADSAW